MASVIPQSGTYLEEQNIAQQAYDQAVAQLKTQRLSRQRQSGLNENWQVDPNSQYGAYQQMLHNQGANLDTARESGYDRGIGGRGLGNQMESSLRYGQAAENLGFQNQLAGYESDYQSGITGAGQNRQSAMLSAVQRAQQEALQRELASQQSAYLAGQVMTTPEAPQDQQTPQAPPEPTYAPSQTMSVLQAYQPSGEVTQASRAPANDPQAAALLNYLKRGRKLEF